MQRASLHPLCHLKGSAAVHRHPLGGRQRPGKEWGVSVHCWPPASWMSESLLTLQTLHPERACAAVTSLGPRAPMLRSNRQRASALSGCSASAALLYARRTCARAPGLSAPRQGQPRVLLGRRVAAACPPRPAALVLCCSSAGGPSHGCLLAWAAVQASEVLTLVMQRGTP